ncbi:hypothetical protein [Sphingobium sp. AP50]|uniref:hypothetical protein n=1 Tax=Sphingobium sp. AP50 TaxID=1884369 RepID=UPI000B81442A|nr:hypothetical protein [Sphingobium sp. AP50]
MWSASLLFALTLAETARAEAIDLAKLCAEGRVRSIQLVNAALNASGAPKAGAMDINGDGTETMREKVEAILDPTFCATSGKARCSKGDQDALDAARDNLLAFLGSEGLSTIPVRKPSALEVRDWPWLADESYAQHAQLLDSQERFATLRCTVDTPTPTPAIAGGPGEKPFDLESKLRVTQTVDGLSLARGTPDKLAKVPQAEISYVDDKIADTRTFNIVSVVGIDLASKSTQQIIPFVHFARRRVKDKDGVVSADAKNSISQWGFGLVYGATLNSYDVISATPLFTADDFADSRQASIRINWTPGFLQSLDAIPFERSRRVGPIAVGLGLQTIIQGGHVFKAGTSAELVENGDYLRAGANLTGNIWSLVDAPILSALSADVSYKHLFRLSGPRKVTWFEAGLNYSVESTDHITLRYSYERGRDDETLKETDQWKVSLGIRY